jgi:chromosome segregation ATPase
MSGFKVIIKATAPSFSKNKLEQVIKTVIESSNSGISIQHIKAKGTSTMNIVDTVNALENTISRRNRSIHSLEQQLNTSEIQVTNLEEQVADLLRIIREREESNSSDDFCNCNDWHSVGSDLESGDKLKRCNICQSVGVR